MAETSVGPKGERVWDPLVRLTHWAIAASVLLNGLVVEEESLAHIWIGYVALALFALRLLWGFIGTEEARFSSFPPSLSAALGHVADMLAGRRRDHRSHNPLGALMVYALWGMLAVVSVTGVMLESDPFPNAVAYASDDDGYGREYLEREDGGQKLIKETHEAAANLLLLLAALHVAGVAIESHLSGVNLVRAMVTGVKSQRVSR